MAWRWSVCGTAEVVWKPRFLWQWPSASLHFLVSCFSFSSWQCSTDSLWGSGLVSLLASQAHQHHGHLTHFWCFWRRRRWRRIRRRILYLSHSHTQLFNYTTRQCGTRGAVGGSVPCSTVSPQFLPEPRFEPTTLGYKSNALSIRATTAPFGSVGRCQILLENEISIFKKLVSRRKHEVLQIFLVNWCSDVAFQKTQWTNTSRCHCTPNHHRLWNCNTGLQATWAMSFSTLPPDSTN